MMHHLSIEQSLALEQPIRFLLEEGFVRGSLLVYGSYHAWLLIRGRVRSAAFYEPQEGVLPSGRFDTVVSFFAPEHFGDERTAGALMDVSALLAAGGRGYFVMRNDPVQRTGLPALRAEEVAAHRRHGLPLREVHATADVLVQEYIPYTETHQGNEKASPFFAIDEPRELLMESPDAFAIYDKFPVAPGHALVIPKRVVDDYFRLPEEEQAACWTMVSRVKRMLDGLLKPDGYTVGINAGEAAGQTVPHVHIHVIPRYWGDVEFPRGGFRGVIPGKRSY